MVVLSFILGVVVGAGLLAAVAMLIINEGGDNVDL